MSAPFIDQKVRLLTPQGLTYTEEEAAALMTALTDVLNTYQEDALRMLPLLVATCFAVGAAGLAHLGCPLEEMVESLAEITGTPVLARGVDASNADEVAQDFAQALERVKRQKPEVLH